MLSERNWGYLLNISWSGIHLFSNLLPGLVLFLLFSLLGRDESQVERRLLWPGRRRRRRPGRATPASAELLLVPMSAGQSPGKERQVRCCCCYCETRGSRDGTNWTSLEKRRPVEWVYVLIIWHAAGSPPDDGWEGQVCCYYSENFGETGSKERKHGFLNSLSKMPAAMSWDL